MKKCEGCQAEMEECYEWQSKGFDAGLRWDEESKTHDEHCFVFVLNKKGEFIIE
jgi:hypothetical protein